MTQNREKTTPSGLRGCISAGCSTLVLGGRCVSCEASTERAALARAAERVRECLTKAEEGNYLRDAWYAYMSRRDVERLLMHAEAS